MRWKAEKLKETAHFDLKRPISSVMHLNSSPKLFGENPRAEAMKLGEEPAISALIFAGSNSLVEKC